VPEDKVDLAILGGGTGGYVAAIRAAQLGMNVVVVERDKLGGTCLHRGCIPSKALLRSAEVFSTAKEAELYGVIHDTPRFELGRAMERKQQIVDQLHKGVAFLMKKNKIRVVEGIGRVMGPSIFSPQAGSVMVEYENGETEIISPRFTLVATGSKPRSLPGLDIDGEKVISSDHALALSAMPKSVIVVGAGAIGVEWTSLFSDLGVEVTLLEYLPRVLPLEDEEISAEVARILKKRKVNVVTGAKVLPATLVKESDKVTIQAETNGGMKTFCADLMLVAVGRAPVTDNIGLEATEIVIERGAIVVDENYRTKEDNIFAIGDVIGGVQLAHVAAHEGIHAVEVMAGMAHSPIDYSLIAKCTYFRPEVASVGLTEKQATDNGHQVKVGKFPFKAIGKALVYGEADGFVKIVADKDTDDILGVHMVGPHVTDFISEAGLARVLNATPWEVGHTIHPHPTLSEAIGEAALAVDGRAIHG
jgi:dihydrolipoamide dehydrogenase